MSIRQKFAMLSDDFNEILSEDHEDWKVAILISCYAGNKCGDMLNHM